MLGFVVMLGDHEKPSDVKNFIDFPNTNLYIFDLPEGKTEADYSKYKSCYVQLTEKLPLIFFLKSTEVNSPFSFMKNFGNPISINGLFGCEITEPKKLAYLKAINNYMEFSAFHTVPSSKIIFMTTNKYEEISDCEIIPLFKNFYCLIESEDFNMDCLSGYSHEDDSFTCTRFAKEPISILSTPDPQSKFGSWIYIGNQQSIAFSQVDNIDLHPVGIDNFIAKTTYFPLDYPIKNLIRIVESGCEHGDVVWCYSSGNMIKFVFNSVEAKTNAIAACPSLLFENDETLNYVTNEEDEEPDKWIIYGFSETDSVEQILKSKNSIKNYEIGTNRLNKISKLYPRPAIVTTTHGYNLNSDFPATHLKLKKIKTDDVDEFLRSLQHPKMSNNRSNPSSSKRPEMQPMSKQKKMKK